MERLPMEQFDGSIRNDWNKLLEDTSFLTYLEESLGILPYEKKTRTVEGNRIKGAQMFAIKQALESGKDKKGAVYFLMRALHRWRQMYFYQIKFNPDSHIGLEETVSKQFFKGVTGQYELEIEELVEQLEGNNTMSLTEHNTQMGELNDKVYQLETENKRLKESMKKEITDSELYHKKKAEHECLMLQKKVDWLNSEMTKITHSQNKELLAHKE